MAGAAANARAIETLAGAELARAANEEADLPHLATHGVGG